ncbi:hypothetical protein FVW27_08310 [Desulfovibrio sp. XJ01]|nr:hypothetical protein [Nitratidesulfovibrio liaohensis]NHZ46636.1 hypothetical protein [Nitratidesulfovibrio liaohensis]
MTATGSTHGTVRCGVFRFDPAHPLFADHFPGAPVVPGSCIVQAFADEASRWAHELTLEDGGTPYATEAGRQADMRAGLPAGMSATPQASSAGVPPHSVGDGPDGRMSDGTCASSVMRPICPIRPTCKARGFRFRRFVSPGDYAFRMECTDEGLRCSLHALPHGHAGEGHGMNGPGAAYGPDATPPPASPPLVTGVLAW